MRAKTVLAITFDIDWAPDWCIALCWDLCRQAGAKSTFFVTHQSDILADMARDRDVELGIHPNLLPGSTQGQRLSDCFDFFDAFMGDYRTMRTHGLYQSSPLMAEVADSGRIRSDVSLYLPWQEGLRPSRYYYSHNQAQGLVRLPYYFEDDAVAFEPDWSWSRVPRHRDPQSLYIYDFHPIHVGLNMQDMGQYAALKQSLNGPLSEASPAQVAAAGGQGQGTRSFLEQVLEQNAGHPNQTIDGIAQAFLAEAPATPSHGMKEYIS